MSFRKRALLPALQKQFWGKLFAKHISDKRLVVKLCKVLIKLSNKTTNNPINNGKRPEDLYTKEIYTWHT